MSQDMNRRGPQGGSTAWNAPGPGPLGFGPQIARRLGLTEDQVQKIRDIVEKSRSRTLAAIKQVLTEEQAEQFDRMHERAGQLGRGRGGPAMQDGRGGPAERGFRRGQGQGPGAQVGPQGQGRWGQSFEDESRPGRGFRPGRGQGPGAQMGPQGQGRWGQSFEGGPGAGRGMGRQRSMNRPDAAPESRPDGQGVNPVPSQNRGVPPIERMFDRADTNNDGALTREEIRAFHESMGPRPGWRRQ